ncbi:MAG: hypothetical protein ACOVNU_04595 [Candidatus Kapaibacteriota bacterium]
MQELKFENIQWNESDVDDDLVWNIPIYDVVNRKYAAFSSLLEAIKKQENDPKGNGKYFIKSKEIKNIDFITLCYLFRLCGSGINYVPKKDLPFNTHGFGNFWIVDLLKDGITDSYIWIDNLPDNKFCDVKGYLLPMIKGGLNNFIKNESIDLVNNIYNYIIKEKVGIKDVVDYGNSYLLKKGYKRQNFVLTAFAMDLAEYFPDIVDRDSDVYVGSNAKKCLKLILPNLKEDKAIRYLCDITGGFSKPYDMEDVACDFIRYLDNFQSEDHIKLNNGIKYRNNVH